MCQKIRFLIRTHFLACRGLLFHRALTVGSQDFLLCLHMEAEMLHLPLLRRHQSHHGCLTLMSPSKPNSLQRPHLHIPTHNVGGEG